MMRRYDLGDGIVEIKHSDGSDRWLVVKTNHSGYFLMLISGSRVSTDDEKI